MFRLRFIVSLFVALILAESSRSVETVGKDRNILILFSLSPSRPAYRIMLDEIREKMTEVYGDNYNLHIEYLESERYQNGQYPQERFDVYNKKYHDLDLDLLICVGPNLIEIIGQHADEHFMKFPTLSIDYDYSNYGYPFDIRLNDKTAVVGLKFNIEKTFITAFRLFPDFKNIYIISGMSELDQRLNSLAVKAIRTVGGNKKVTFINNVSMDEALRLLNQIHDSTILFVPGFDLDAEMVTYTNPESVRLFSKTARAPVITFSEVGIGEGVLGGYVLSFRKAGKTISEAAIKVMDGADPESIKIEEEQYYEYIFDWRQLDRWNLTGSSRVPKGSTILFEEITLYRKYRYFILLAVFFLMLQTFLIFKLVLLYRKERQMTLQIKESENRFRVIVIEDRVLRIGQLAASLSHELNQPLTAILSTAQAGIRFLDSGNTDPGLLKEILQNIVEDDKRTAAILGSIRGMIKLEKKEKRVVNLNSLIEEIALIYRGEAIDKQVDLTIKLHDGPVYVMADPIQIQQVIMNFITNALYAVKTARAENRVINISESVDNEKVTVSVRDNGSGIDEALINKLFKPFVTSKEEGIGIGLSISRSIIIDHNGKIWAENKQDGGAEFFFSLNLHDNEPSKK